MAIAATRVEREIFVTRPSAVGQQATTDGLERASASALMRSKSMERRRNIGAASSRGGTRRDWSNRSDSGKLRPRRPPDIAVRQNPERSPAWRAFLRSGAGGCFGVGELAAALRRLSHRGLFEPLARISDDVVDAVAPLTPDDHVADRESPEACER